MIVDGTRATSDLRDEADFVVIGSGAAGATAAKVLAEAKQEVIILEEGKYYRRKDFSELVFPTMTNLFREMGTTAAMGKVIIPIIQGCCVGGSTTINGAIIWRLHDDIYDLWSEKFGIGETVNKREVERCFDQIERDLNVHPPLPEVRGENNSLAAQGCEKLGYSYRYIPRNEKDCRGSGRCLVGCPNRAKLSMELSYIPDALRAGAKLYTSARASRIEMKQGRGEGVHALLRDHQTGQGKYRLFVRARKGVIVAASAVQTPNLLRQSGIGIASGHLGEHFQAHPGTGIGALFDHEVRLWEGATQGWDSAHFRQSDRIKFEALGLQPELAAVRVPGVGQKFLQFLADYERLAIVAVALWSEAEGRVRPRGRSASVSFSLHPHDLVHLRRGIQILAEIMVAAGAKAIYPSVWGLPSQISKDQLRLLDQLPLDPRAYGSFVMTHMFGTARMSPDPRRGVVGLDFQCHDAKGVYVVDSSVFPTNLGTNPQHAIMAVAMLAARRLVNMGSDPKC
jgi:choline dehydrogenase-like flavoprotein